MTVRGLRNWAYVAPMELWSRNPWILQTCRASGALRKAGGNAKGKVENAKFKLQDRLKAELRRGPGFGDSTRRTRKRQGTGALQNASRDLEDGLDAHPTAKSDGAIASARRRSLRGSLVSSRRVFSRGGGRRPGLRGLSVGDRQSERLLATRTRCGPHERRPRASRAD